MKKEQNQHLNTNRTVLCLFENVRIYLISSLANIGVSLNQFKSKEVAGEKEEERVSFTVRCNWRGILYE